MTEVAPGVDQPPQQTNEERMADMLRGEGGDEERQPAKGAKNTDPANSKFERARTALLRTGALKDDDIRKMDRDEVIRRGLKAKRQMDRQAAEYAKLKAETQRKGDGSQAPSGPATQSRVPSGSDGNLISELLAELDLTGDAEAEAALKAKLSAVLSERAQLKGELEQRGRANDPDVNQLIRLMKVRSELTESIPELADNDDWGSHVSPAIEALAGLPRFANADRDDDTLRDLVAAAARMSLEEVGERGDPAEQRGAARRGIMDTSSSTQAIDNLPETVKDRAKEMFVRLGGPQRSRIVMGLMSPRGSNN